MRLASDKRTPLELTDYAERYLVDRFSSIDGVARVQIGGQRTPAMRVWLDRRAIAARGLTVGDIERAVPDRKRGNAGRVADICRSGLHQPHRPPLPHA